MIHPAILHEMARSVQQDMEREARNASLARAVARPRATQPYSRARAAVLASTVLAMAGALLLI